MVEVERLLQRIKEGYSRPSVKDTLLDTPQGKLKDPLLIESERLGGERVYLVANEAQAQEIEKKGEVPYLPEEIRALLALSTVMNEGSRKDYLLKIHEVKKTFPGSRIHNYEPLL